MPADRCDPNRENRGCDEQEVKYIEKIKTKIDGDTAQLKRESNKRRALEQGGRVMRMPLLSACLIDFVAVDC